MKEDLIKMARDAGFGIGQGIGAIRINGYADNLDRFAKLVEQATLERAAKKFDYFNGTEWFAENVAEELRALKDSNG